MFVVFALCLACVAGRDPPAFDLLAPHAFVYPLSFPFGRLPRRLALCSEREAHQL